MRKIINGIRVMFHVCLCIIVLTVTVCAHSGRTDSNGGHRDNKNKSGLGSYHYHCGGYPAHLHSDGYCPYTETAPTYSDSTVTDSNSYSKYTEVVPTDVSISVEKSSLKIGEEVSIDAAVYPANSNNTDVSLESSNSEVVTVSEGKLKAVGYGTAVITATSHNGVVSSVTISVKEVVAEKIEIVCEQSIIDGDSCKAEVVFYPENTTVKDIKWKISDEKVATIDSDGNVQAVGVGKATITAVQKDVKATFDIEVVPKKVESIYIEADITDKLYKGDIVNFKAEVSPADATYPQVYWSVSDEEVATIDENGVLEVLSVGETIVTAYTEDGCSEIYEIEVHNTPESVLAVVAGGAVVAVGGALGVRKYKGGKKA